MSCWLKNVVPFQKIVLVVTPLFLRTFEIAVTYHQRGKIVEKDDNVGK